MLPCGVDVGLKHFEARSGTLGLKFSGGSGPARFTLRLRVTTSG